MRRVLASGLLACGATSMVSCEPAAAPTQTLASKAPLADTLTARSDSTSRSGPAQTAPGTATIAELPRETVGTSYPVGLRAVRVAQDADLQAAIDAAQPGDELLLAPGATYVGNFTLPNKGTSTAWVVLRTDLTDAALGQAGTRMTPSRAAALALARVLSPNYSPAIGTDAGAHHYRLTGLELGVTSAATQMNMVVRLGDGPSVQTTMASVPHDLVLERSYVHGTPTLDLKRCVALNSAMTAVVDSWLAECHSNNGDSQAILGYNGPGPFRIQNNYLEAGHEVVMFGGGDPGITGLVPSDIELRGNHITRPLAWKGVWQVKNLVETKNARRFLIEGNVIENEWADAQAGFAFVLKSANQDGTAPWSVSSDITIRYNRIRNTGNGFNLAADPLGTAVPASRFVITDNIMENVNTGPYVGDGHTVQLLGGLADIVLMHNTVVSANGSLATTVVLGALPAIQRLVVHSNVFHHGVYGIKGGGSTEGSASIDEYAPGAMVSGNVFVEGGEAGVYPLDNFFSPALGDVGFRDLVGGDYRLNASSYRKRGFGGRDIGADVDAVDAATAAAVVAP